MMIGRSETRRFTPSGAEIGAVLLAVSWFWFLADNVTRFAIGVAGILVALSLSRTTGLIRAYMDSRRSIVWSALVVSLLLLAPLAVGYQIRSPEMIWFSLIALSVLGVDLLAIVADRVRFGSTGYLAVGIIAAAMMERYIGHSVAGMLSAAVLVSGGLALGMVVVTSLAGNRGLGLLTALVGLGAPLLLLVPSISALQTGVSHVSWFQVVDHAEMWQSLSLPQVSVIVTAVLTVALLVVLVARKWTDPVAVARSKRLADLRVDGPEPVIGYVICAANAGIGGAIFFLLEPSFVDQGSLIMILAVDVVISAFVLGRASILGALFMGLAAVVLYQEGLTPVIQRSMAGDLPLLAWAFALFGLAVAILLRWRSSLGVPRSFSS